MNCLTPTIFNEDVHELLNTMAECKTSYQCRSQGEVESEWKLASNLTYLRRQVSVCAVRAVADSLLARLQHSGPPGRGAAQAARRRALGRGDEEGGEGEEREGSALAAPHPRLPGAQSWPIPQQLNKKCNNFSCSC